MEETIANNPIEATLYLLPDKPDELKPQLVSRDMKHVFQMAAEIPYNLFAIMILPGSIEKMGLLKILINYWSMYTA